MLSREPFPHIYFSYLQENWTSMSLVVRAGPVESSIEPMMMAAPIRSALAAIDKNQPIHSFKTLEDTVSDLVAPQRFTTFLLAGFAALAALLAAIGLYGVISYAVMQRTREVGIRMALGADRRTVMRMVVQQGMGLAVAGIGIGLAASFALTRVLKTLLFGVSTTDPEVFIGVALMLLAVAVGACSVPALRASKVDPMVALRYD
jgi:putative ABC transport system permease protein